MSEMPSEYHKKTCIICGCHTNQTINIYEPRSGPNIVRLIQARFKFQPLNEDKYLCYSCNNWLINWHSLQALNSNDADNPSGTFRSSHMNNVVSEKSSPSEAQLGTKTKPVAQVRPQLRDEQELNNSQLPMPVCHSANTKRKGWYLSKRTFLSWHRMKTKRRKPIYPPHLCCICGKTILRKNKTAVRSKSNNVIFKCMTCRTMLYWRHLCLKTLLVKRAKLQLSKLKSLRQTHHVNLVSEASDEKSTSNLPYQPQKYQRPLVDGKIVSMLRRLGTTLSRDKNSMLLTNEPPIMSPTKEKTQRWTSQVSDDEVLVSFNTAIAEVLPIRHMRRKLKYPVSDTTMDVIEINSSDEEDNDVESNIMTTKYEVVNLEHYYNIVPKGLSLFLVPASEAAPVN